MSALRSLSGRKGTRRGADLPRLNIELQQSCRGNHFGSSRTLQETWRSQNDDPHRRCCAAGAEPSGTDLLLNEVYLVADFQNDLPEVHADRTLIQQVILNLVRNAIDAMNSTPLRARGDCGWRRSQRTFVHFVVRSRHRAWNNRRTTRVYIRAVLYNKANRYGIGARHLSDYRPGPRGQFEASQDGLRRILFLK